MDYVIKILEKERKTIEGVIRDQDLMHANMKKAQELLKGIAEIKRAMKMLKTKSLKTK